MNHSAAASAPAMWDGWASSTDQATFENPPVQTARIPLEAAQALPTQKEVRGCRSRLRGTRLPPHHGQLASSKRTEHISQDFLLPPGPGSCRMQATLEPLGSCSMNSNVSCPKLASGGGRGTMALAQMAGDPIFFNNRVEAENQAPGREL